MSTIRQLVGRIAIETRYRGATDSTVLGLRQKLNAALAEKAIRTALDRTPAVSDEQRKHLVDVVLTHQP